MEQCNTGATNSYESRFLEAVEAVEVQGAGETGANADERNDTSTDKNDGEQLRVDDDDGNGDASMPGGDNGSDERGNENEDEEMEDEGKNNG